MRKELYRNAGQTRPAPGFATKQAVRRFALATLVLAGAGLMYTAQAQLPPAETAQGVQYVTGGFGSDAAAAFKDAKARYPLSLTFAATGEDGSTPYVAEVRVEIEDEQGKNILSLPSVGPFLLVDVPPGSYTVRATYEGKTQTQKMTVSGDGSADARIAWQRPAGGPD